MATMETEEGQEQPLSLPQKRYYRQRAHSNPLSDHCFDYPIRPDQMDWRTLYGQHYEPEQGREVKMADVGCGYGGLLVKLSPLYPEKLLLGLEIRVKVSDYVKDRIKALRTRGECLNAACLRLNAMKHLPNLFRKGQLEKMFFLFPDPHFKKAKHKWRIVNETLLAEYAYVLSVGGRLYAVTDVEDLYLWMDKHLNEHPLFRRVEEEDSLKEVLFDSTEEGQKVTRNGGQKWCIVYERIKDPFEDNS